MIPKLPLRVPNSVLSDKQLQFLYKEVLLYSESDSSSYGSAEKIIAKVKKESSLQHFDFVYDHYESAMKTPVDDTFYFSASSKKKVKRSNSLILKKWFAHLRNAFAHNYITIENGKMLMQDFQNESPHSQTLYVQLSSFELFEKLVFYIKQLINKKVIQK